MKAIVTDKWKAYVDDSRTLNYRKSINTEIKFNEDILIEQFLQLFNSYLSKDAVLDTTELFNGIAISITTDKYTEKIYVRIYENEINIIGFFNVSDKEDIVEMIYRLPRFQSLAGFLISSICAALRFTDKNLKNSYLISDNILLHNSFGTETMINKQKVFVIDDGIGEIIRTDNDRFGIACIDDIDRYKTLVFEKLKIELNYSDETKLIWLSSDKVHDITEQNYTTRWKAVINGEYLDDLYKDLYSDIRLEVARQGAHLDDLYKDPSWVVRMEVAAQGAHLDDLYNDEHPDVRIEVAKHGAHLDDLYKDPSWLVRMEVAKQGAHLDDLYNDEHPDVRIEVAKHGAHLDDLYKDENYFVRKEALNQRNIRLHKS